MANPKELPLHERLPLAEAEVRELRREIALEFNALRGKIDQGVDSLVASIATSTRAGKPRKHRP